MKETRLVSFAGVEGTYHIQSDSASQDNKPAPGWVEVDPNERKREIRLPSPPGKEEPKVPSEPAVFRQPVRKRPRTRWHADDDRDRSSDRAKDRDQDGASHEATNGRSATESHRREKNSREQTDDTPKTVAKRKASPQVGQKSTNLEFSKS